MFSLNLKPKISAPLEETKVLVKVQKSSAIKAAGWEREALCDCMKRDAWKELMDLKYYGKDRVYFPAANECVTRKEHTCCTIFQKGNKCGVPLKSLLQGLFLIHDLIEVGKTLAVAGVHKYKSKTKI